MNRIKVDVCPYCHREFVFGYDRHVERCARDDQREWDRLWLARVLASGQEAATDRKGTSS